MTADRARFRHQKSHESLSYEEILPQLQLVIIDSFYDTVQQDVAMDWLGKLFRFKVSSYRQTYPYGMLPFGDVDLIGTHWILCRRQDENLLPITSFKTIDSSKTELFRMEFPALAFADGPQQALHRLSIQHELKKAQRGGYRLGYLASWVVDPEFRKRMDPKASKLCRKIISACFSCWIESYSIQTALTFAVLRFHVDQIHADLGMQRLRGPQGEFLPDYTPSLSFGEPVSISVLYRENHSTLTQQDYMDLKHSPELKELWENRMVIASTSSPLGSFV